MSVERLSPRFRRVTAVTLLGVALIMGIGLVAGPYWAIVSSYDRTLTRLTDKLRVYQESVQRGVAAQEQKRGLARLERTNGYYLNGDKFTLAAAELQRRVKQVIEQHGGTVVSSQVLGEKNDQGLQPIALRVTMRSGMDSFGKVLYTLEMQSPILVFENIHIGARPGGTTTARWRGSGTAQEIDVRFDVLGFRRGVERS